MYLFQIFFVEDGKLIKYDTGESVFDLLLISIICLGLIIDKSENVSCTTKCSTIIITTISLFKNNILKTVNIRTVYINRMTQGTL